METSNQALSFSQNSSSQLWNSVRKGLSIFRVIKVKYGISTLNCLKNSTTVPIIVIIIVIHLFFIYMCCQVPYYTHTHTHTHTHARTHARTYKEIACATDSSIFSKFVIILICLLIEVSVFHIGDSSDDQVIFGCKFLFENGILNS